MLPTTPPTMAGVEVGEPDAGAGAATGAVGVAAPPPGPPKEPPVPLLVVELELVVWLLLVDGKENEVEDVDDDSEVVKEIDVWVEEEELAKKLLTVLLLKGKAVEEELELKDPETEGNVVELREEGARDDKKVAGAGVVGLLVLLLKPLLVLVLVLVLVDEGVGRDKDTGLLPGLSTLLAVAAGGSGESLERVPAGDRVLVLPVVSSMTTVTGGENTVDTLMMEPLPSR